MILFLVRVCVYTVYLDAFGNANLLVNGLSLRLLVSFVEYF